MPKTSPSSICLLYTSSTAVEQEQNLKDQLEQIEQERFEWELERENYVDQINELKGQLHMARSRADQFQSEAVLSGHCLLYPSRCV